MFSTEKVADYNMIKQKILKVNHTITGAWQRELEDSPREKTEHFGRREGIIDNQNYKIHIHDSSLL